MSEEHRHQVQEANAAFYRAVESGSIEAMAEVWAHEPWVKCVHPGWDMIAGWKSVRESWERIFESATNMSIMASEISVQLDDGFAWVTCIENITIFYEGSFDSAQAAATNIFMRRDDRWLLVHHHASPIPVMLPDAASDAIQ